MRLSLACVEGPAVLGTMWLACSDRGLVALDFESREGRLGALLRRRYGSDPAFDEVDDPLGAPSVSERPPRRPVGLSARRWRHAVPTPGLGHAPWHSGGLNPQLRSDRRRDRDPIGIAGRRLGQRSRPINVAVPCHRVIGSDGALTGYGGGLGRKRWLLVHKAAQEPRLL